MQNNSESANMLQEAILQLMFQNIRTVTIGVIERVVSMDPPVVDVQPQISKLYVDGEKLDYADIKNVPLGVYGTKETLIKFPKSSYKKQPVILLFFERSTQTWLNNEKLGPPEDRGKFQDCVAIPMIWGFKSGCPLNTDDENFAIKYKKNQITIDKDDNIIIESNKDVTIKATNVNVDLEPGGKFSVAGNNLTVDA